MRIRLCLNTSTLGLSVALPQRIERVSGVMLMNKYTVLTAIAILIVGFQNCSNTTSFDASGSLIAKTGINDVTGEIDEPVEPPADVGNNDGAVIPVPPPTPSQPPMPGAVPPAYPPVVDRDHDHDHDHDNDHDDDKECVNRGPGHGGSAPGERPDDDKKNPSTSNLVACILEGPGSSVKVAFGSAGLSGQNRVEKSACMSENACLNLVSKILPVKSAERRGYCDHNQNVISMTDAEVEAAVNQALLTKLVSSR